MRIAAIEGDPILRGMFSELLEAAGHSVVTYRTGADFLLHTIPDPGLHFQLVLLDLYLLGGVSAYQILKHLRVHAPELQVIVLVAEDRSSKLIEKHFAGINILRKPFHIRDLCTLMGKQEHNLI